MNSAPAQKYGPKLSANKYSSISPFKKNPNIKNSLPFTLYSKTQNLIPCFSEKTMNFLKPKPQEPSPQFNLQQAFTNLQNHFSSLKPHLESTFLNLQNHAKQAIESGFSRPFKFSSPSAKNPAWARISAEKNGPSTSPSSSSASLSIEEIEERLAGVPVYALSNPSEEFVLVSNVDSGKSLGLFCFKEEDAETLLAQMKNMDPGMRQGSKVVAVALNKV